MKYLSIKIHRKKRRLTKHVEFAGGGSGAYFVLCLAGVLSNVSFSGFAELQTGHAFGVLQLAGGAGPDFTIGLEPGHLDLRCARYLTLKTHGVSCCHLHRLQCFKEVWRLCAHKTTLGLKSFRKQLSLGLQRTEH